MVKYPVVLLRALRYRYIRCSGVGVHGSLLSQARGLIRLSAIGIMIRFCADCNAGDELAGLLTERRRPLFEHGFGRKICFPKRKEVL